MLRKYRFYQIDSFTKEKFTGNPAGVVMGADSLTEIEMQKIARELNNSETAFILSPDDSTHDVHIRYFTPTNEVPVCGHATIAAHYARAVENGIDTARVYQKTGAGILPVDVVREGDDYQIIMTQGRICFGDIISGNPLEMLQTALNIAASDLREDCPVQIMSTGHSKVMVGIQDDRILHNLRPNMELLTRLSGNIGCNGYYVFTLHPNEDIFVHGRMFAPAIGIQEDPVTGNANGPLGAYLVHYKLVTCCGDMFRFRAMQGEAIGRTGTMDVQVKIRDSQPEEVKIAGNAVIVYKAELTVD